MNNYLHIWRNAKVHILMDSFRWLIFSSLFHFEFFFSCPLYICDKNKTIWSTFSLISSNFFSILITSIKLASAFNASSTLSSSLQCLLPPEQASVPLIHDRPMKRNEDKRRKVKQCRMMNQLERFRMLMIRNSLIDFIQMIKILTLLTNL